MKTQNAYLVRGGPLEIGGGRGGGSGGNFRKKKSCRASSLGKKHAELQGGEK